MSHYWSGDGMHEGEPHYAREAASALAMSEGYLSEHRRWIACGDGNHTWASWNGNSGYRVCTFCGLEMPDSRKGQPNHRTWAQAEQEQANSDTI